MKEEIQRIDLNDYVQTGEGGTALTYNHKDGKTLAKLFMSTIAADNAASLSYSCSIGICQNS